MTEYWIRGREKGLIIVGLNRESTPIGRYGPYIIKRVSLQGRVYGAND